MKNTECLLIEIGVEELPINDQTQYAIGISNQIQHKLHELCFEFGEIELISSPRRFGFLLHHLTYQSKSQLIEKYGPPASIAFKDNKPTIAAEKFAQSLGISVEDIQIKNTDKGEYIFGQTNSPILNILDILPDLLSTALKNLPIKNTMRWGNVQTGFIRPVHWICALYGNDIIHFNFLGIESNRYTYGHRILCSSEFIIIKNASDYLIQMQEQSFVVTNYHKRKSLIQELLNTSSKDNNLVCPIDEQLLNIVTSIVEYPVILIAEFHKKYLELPQEFLISAMKDHQKCFPLFKSNGELSNKFLITSNNLVQHPDTIIGGNQFVMNARLEDALFYYHIDLKTSLLSKTEALNNISFAEELGSMFDKTKRLEQIAVYIFNNIDLNILNANSNSLEQLKIAAQYAKADLASNVVGEVPELAGIIGKYYAEKEGLSKNVSDAIYEHHLPKTANDELPTKLEGIILSLADKIDTITALFSVNKIPSSDKDPFGLRRAALSIIKIVDQYKINLNIENVFSFALEQLKNHKHKDILGKITFFISERTKHYAASSMDNDHGITAAIHIKNNFDINEYIKIFYALHAVVNSNKFHQLIAVNKRLFNISVKENFKSSDNHYIDRTLCNQHDLSLLKDTNQIFSIANDLLENNSFIAYFNQLADLASIIEHYFNSVMIMDPDDSIRINRINIVLALYKELNRIVNLSAINMMN